MISILSHLFFISLITSHSSFDDLYNHRKLAQSSYNEATRLIKSNFDYRCSLALQNCLYQTQWQHVFSNKLQTDLISYHYCKAFLISQFCIDDYLPRSEDNLECIQGIHGNRPYIFRNDIYRPECKKFYTQFLASQQHNLNRHVTLRPSLSNCLLCFLVLFFLSKKFINHSD